MVMICKNRTNSSFRENALTPHAELVHPKVIAYTVNQKPLERETQRLSPVVIGFCVVDLDDVLPSIQI